MKRILLVLFALILCLSAFAGCNNAEIGETESASTAPTEAPTEKPSSSQKPEITAECVVKKGSRYVIVLPESGYSIPVDNDLTKYLYRVSDELVAAAEEKIAGLTAEYTDDPNWTISSHDGKEMCLVVEVIEFVEGADYMEEAGCGIDHHHIFFAESIIVED